MDEVWMNRFTATITSSPHSAESQDPIERSVQQIIGHIRTKSLRS